MIYSKGSDGDLRSPDAVGALHHAAVFGPAYHDGNESRPLATKAIWALGVIPDGEAQRALTELRIEGVPPLRFGDDLA